MARESRGRGLRALAASRYWSEADARCALEAARASGLSDADFGRKCGVRPERLQWWRRHLEGSAGVAAENEVGFVPVRLVGGAAGVGTFTPAEQATAGADEVACTARGSMEVVLASGRLVRVGSDFDATALARLVAVLEGGASC